MKRKEQVMIKDWGREEYLDGAISRFAVLAPNDGAIYLGGDFDNAEFAEIVARAANRYLKGVKR